MASNGSASLSAEEVFNTGVEGNVLLGLGTVLELVMIVALAARLYTKQFILRRWLPDDFTSIAAVLFTTTYFIVGCYAVTTAASNSIAAGHATDDFLIATWLTQWLSPVAFVFAKLSFFILYMQIFRPVAYLRLAALIGAIYVSVLWGFLFFFRLIAITPRAGQPWSVVQTNWGAQTNHELVLIAGPFDVISDLHILLLPLVGIRRLKLEGRRRFGLVAITLAGLLAVIASAVSLYYRSNFANMANTQFSFYTVTLCAIIELQIGVTCACLPAASALLRHYFSSWNSNPSAGADTSWQQKEHSRSHRAYVNVPDSKTSLTGKAFAENITVSNSSDDIGAVRTPRTIEISAVAVPHQEMSLANSRPTSSRIRDQELEMARLQNSTRSSRPTSLRSGMEVGAGSDRDPRRQSRSRFREFASPPTSPGPASRRGSFLLSTMKRAASPWGLRKGGSSTEDDDPNAALGSTILVSTEVQITRNNSVSEQSVSRGHLRSASALGVAVGCEVADMDWERSRNRDRTGTSRAGSVRARSRTEGAGSRGSVRGESVYGRRVRKTTTTTTTVEGASDAAIRSRVAEVMATANRADGSHDGADWRKNDGSGRRPASTRAVHQTASPSGGGGPDNGRSWHRDTNSER